MSEFSFLIFICNFEPKFAPFIDGAEKNCGIFLTEFDRALTLDGREGDLRCP